MERELQIRMAQKERMNRQSWDYLNRNDEDYAKLIVHQGEKNGLGYTMSVKEVKDKV